jgi:hypothetical protein
MMMMMLSLIRGEMNVSAFRMISLLPVSRWNDVIVST